MSQNSVEDREKLYHDPEGVDNRGSGCLSLGHIFPTVRRKGEAREGIENETDGVGAYDKLEEEVK